MITVWKNTGEIVNRIYIPKYYDPTIEPDLTSLNPTHSLTTLGELVAQGHFSVSTGNEIGKMLYGTGDIPFVRTSDISNWEIKTVPKQGVSEEVYRKYASKQDVRADDILLVRDGTYLIGTNCLVSFLDNKFVYQSHILKIRVEASSPVPPQLLFLALNSGIVQRQIRNKQFTADTIDTMGDRYKEVVIAIPRSKARQRGLVDERAGQGVCQASAVAHRRGVAFGGRGSLGHILLIAALEHRRRAGTGHDYLGIRRF